MASKSKIAKRSERRSSPRARTPLPLCGRPRAVYRKFGICRICFKNWPTKGLSPASEGELVRETHAL